MQVCMHGSHTNHHHRNKSKQTVEDLVEESGRKGPEDTCYIRLTSFNHVRVIIMICVCMRVRERWAWVERLTNY